MNRPLPKAETPRTNSWHTQTHPTRTDPAQTASHTRRRHRRTYWRAHTRPTANVPASANVPWMLCQHRSLDPSESQHASSNHHNFLEA